MAASFLQPVSARVTVQDVVYRQLREALMSGHFDPGQTLTIAMLSEVFRTSHMPVREALRRLIAESALTVTTTGSAQVPTISHAALDDLALTRIALETLAAEMATQRSTPEDLAAIRALKADHDAAVAARDLPRMLTANRALHLGVYDRSGSPVTVQFIHSLWLRFGPYMAVLSRHIEPLLASGRYRPSRHHEALLAAMEAGRPRAAAAAIKADIEATQALLRRLGQKQDWPLSSG